MDRQINEDVNFKFTINSQEYFARIYEEVRNDYSIKNKKESVEHLFNDKAICIDFDKEICGTTTLYFNGRVFAGFIPDKLLDEVIVEKTDFLEFKDNDIYLKSRVLRPINREVFDEVYYKLKYIGCDGVNPFQVNVVKYEPLQLTNSLTM